MARVTRRVATVTLVIDAKSDENTFKGAGYIGGQTSAQLEVTLTALMNELFDNHFPRPHKKSSLELDSVTVVVS